MVGLPAVSAMLTAGGVDGVGGGGAARAGSRIRRRPWRRGGAEVRPSALRWSRAAEESPIRSAAGSTGNRLQYASFAEGAAAEDDGAALVSVKPGGTAEDDGPAFGFMAASATGTQEDVPGAVP